VEVGLYAVLILVVGPFLVSLRLARGEDWHPNFFLFWVIVAALISGLVLLVRWLRRAVRDRGARR
jgi:hypothetical protein